MDPITIGLLAGGGMGLVKHMMAADQEKKQNNIRAEQTRYSPWTGISPDKAPTHDSLAGSLLQGAGAGAMVGGSMGTAGGGAAGAVPAAGASDAPAAAGAGVQSTEMAATQAPNLYSGARAPKQNPWMGLASIGGQMNGGVMAGSQNPYQFTP